MVCMILNWKLQLNKLNEKKSFSLHIKKLLIRMVKELQKIMFRQMIWVVAKVKKFKRLR